MSCFYSVLEDGLGEVGFLSVVFILSFPFFVNIVRIQQTEGATFNKPFTIEEGIIL